MSAGEIDLDALLADVSQQTDAFLAELPDPRELVADLDLDALLVPGGGDLAELLEADPLEGLDLAPLDLADLEVPELDLDALLADVDPLTPCAWGSTPRVVSPR